MKLKLITLLFTSLVVIFITGCSNKKSVDKEENLKAVELYWESAGSMNNARKLTYLLQMVHGKEIEKGKIDRLLAEAGKTNHWTSPIKNEPGILIKIIPDYNEIRVTNVTLADDPKGKNIGEKEAVAIAMGHMKKLAQVKLLNGLKYDTRQFNVGQHIIGEGSMDGKTKREFITEYRVTFRPNINGIELANAGVRLAIHRTGKLSGIRIGGVSSNMKASRNLTRTVSKEAARKKFEQSIPDGFKPSIAWEKVMYVIPDGSRKAMIEPLHVYSYSLTSISDGVKVVSRRKTIGISLTDNSKKLVDFDPPARKHTDQKTTRDPGKDKKLNREDHEEHKI